MVMNSGILSTKFSKQSKVLRVDAPSPASMSDGRMAGPRCKDRPADAAKRKRLEVESAGWSRTMGKMVGKEVLFDL